MTSGVEGWAAAREALRAGRPADAERLGRAALAAGLECAEGWFLLGHVYQSQARRMEAAESYAQALRLRPDYPEASINLGNMLFDQGRLSEAEHCYREALRHLPESPEALVNLGRLLREPNQWAEAEDCYRRALAIRPNLPEAQAALGDLFSHQGRGAEAAECYCEALKLRPDYSEALNNLGNVLQSLGRPGEAEKTFRSVLRLRPDSPAILHNLGVALCNLNRLDEAVGCFRRAMSSGLAVAHSGLLLALQYRAGVTPKELMTAHTEYQRRHAAPLRSCWRPFANDRDPERPLRLGLVSPDFRRHPVGYMLVRAMEALACRPGAVVCYSNRTATDDLTARFKAAAHEWRDVARLSDEQLAEQVRADRIDVLIDLAGHTDGGRLLAFARRPAPVQCTWLGYVGTTGLEAIDYLLADKYLAPPGAESHHRERVLRLPGGHAGYDPPADAPDPGPPPALATGRVTFGCFNNPTKLSPPALSAFADVLRRVPGSRLVMKYRGLGDPAVADRLRARFTAGGIESGRVEVRGNTVTHAEHLASYREIDIALDPWPYGGVMTTCEALWMGVPVVTLPGQTFASRHGLGLLSVVGLAELAARDAEGYAELAANLARDLGRLAMLRSELRGRMIASPLCDGERLADELLDVLRGAWREWVGGRRRH